MVRTKRASSVRSKREIDELFRESFVSTKRAIEHINKKLAEGKSISDEELRFLKRSPDLIKMYQLRETAKEDKELELPEGGLRQFIEREWRLQAICKDRNIVIEVT